MLDKLENAATSKGGLTEWQRKYQSVFKGLIAPSGPALEHPPAAPLLLQLATMGCHADIGEAWTLEMLEEARGTSVSHGTGPSSAATGGDIGKSGTGLRKISVMGRD
jgi:hypothetical protein